MLAPDVRLAINEQEVAAKVIDGEAIIINLTNGIYYSTDKAGAVIWELAASGESIQAITQQLVARYKVSPEQAGQDVARLVQQFVDENLLLQSTSPSSDSSSLSGAVSPVPAARLPYTAPEMQIYRDMGYLLAVDPPMPGLETPKWE